MTMLYAILAVIVVSLASLVWLITFKIKNEKLEKVLIYLVAFSAWALLWDVFFHLLPELVEEWENNKYSFFETTARKWSQRYLLNSFPNLDCRTWTGWIEYDIYWNSHEYIDADCNWYDVVNWEAVKTRKSWIEQLFPYWFIFYDIE